MSDSVILDDLVQPGRVHRRAYTDPDVFALEMDRVFGGTWVYLGHESQVAGPNDFVATHLGLRPVLLTRDADGELHALFNRCSHRASVICHERQGTARNFQCGYHGWTFSNRGALASVPYPTGYDDERFDKNGRGLRQIPRLASYRGLVFGTLNVDAPRIGEWLGAARGPLDYFIDRVPGGGLEVRNCQRLVFEGNWKLAWDNAGDGLHPTFAHRSWVLMNEKRYGEGKSLGQFKNSPDSTGMYGEDLGNGHIIVDQRPGMSRSFWETQRPVPGKETFGQMIRGSEPADADDVLEMVPGSMINLSIFPNLLVKGNQFEVVQPLAPDRTRLNTWVVAGRDVPREVNILRMRIAEDFVSLGNPDDLELFERCQRGLAVGEVEWVDMSKGLGDPLEAVTASGTTRAPVTYETPIRGYIDEWRRLVGSDVELTTVLDGEVDREIVEGPADGAVRPAGSDVAS